MTGSDHISAAIDRLRSGGVVAFPTETVYGLGADATSEAAVRHVFDVKGRPGNNPLIVHVCDEAMARRCVAAWTDDASRLAKALWPGPVSIVLAKSSLIPGVVTGGGGTVAVRCPDHPLTLELIRRFGRPLVGPSANPSGGISPTTAAHVRSAFTESQVLVLDGGACSGGIESTVVDLTDTVVRVLRPGLVSADQIARALGREVLLPPDAGSMDPDAPMKSPGLLSKHYAPKTRTVLCEPHEVDGRLAESSSVVVLTFGPRKIGKPHRGLAMPVEARPYASSLYDTLRRADEAGAALILIERPVFTGKSADASLWQAVMDRLTRASSEA